jgi:hypothetical protein
MSYSVETFIAATVEFRHWLETFDPEKATREQVAAVLERIVDQAPFDVCCRTSRPEHPIRKFKPTARWQADRRKAARLPLDGYRTKLLPNDDATLDTQCSLAYDLADFWEVLWAGTPTEFVAEYFDYVSWGYVNLRMRAAREALLAPADVPDPFAPREIGGRWLRFVSWPNNALSHASEDLVDVRGASTLCGGRLAFHKHTQQQWSCYACTDCRALADGVEPDRSGYFPLVEIITD